MFCRWGATAPQRQNILFPIFEVMGGERNRIHLISEAGTESWPEMTKGEVGTQLAARIAKELKGAAGVGGRSLTPKNERNACRPTHCRESTATAATGAVPFSGKTLASRIVRGESPLLVSWRSAPAIRHPRV